MTEAKDDEAREQRERQDRAPITLRVEYKRVNTFFADYTKNISKGGTFIRTTRPLEVGTEFNFVLSLPEARPEPVELELKGIVKWVVAAGDATPEKPAGMGIQFVFGDEDQRVAVATIVTRMMNDSLGPVLTRKLLNGS